MKTIGIVGGTGWVSSVEYYRLINEGINAKLGGLNFARCILFSINYAEINACNLRQDYDGVYNIVSDAAKKLISIGAEGIVLGANTLHFTADKLQEEIEVPIIHIADAAAAEIKQHNISRIGLLGTRQTMEQDFYKSRLRDAGIETLVPAKTVRDYINDVIMNELLKSNFKAESKKRFIEIIQELNQRGAQGIVLGCTEIPLLIKPGDIDIPLINTLDIHCRAIVDFALEN